MSAIVLGVPKSHRSAFLPQPHRFVADVDTALEQQILHVSQRQREPDVH